MSRPITAAAALLLSASLVRAGTDVGELTRELSSPELEGRGAGTAGIVVARDLVRGHLERAGLEPGFGEEWLQPVDGPDGTTLHNVAGRFAGTSDEWVLIGAHYDGLGIEEDAGQSVVLPGADDNASGVAALVRIAESLAGAAGELERSVWLVAFTGEETELLGSRAFVTEPPAPISDCVAMVNLDTIGRLENDRLIIFGAGTAGEWGAILNGVNHGFRFDLVLNEGSGSASDHAPFVAAKIPSLHVFTGAKPEYHRPGDVVELLNVDGIERIADFVAETTMYLASSGLHLTFREEGTDSRITSKPTGQKRRVSFGSIPDFSRESGGILLEGVMPGGPAEAAGLKKGDLLVRIDDEPLDTLGDFQAVLAAHEPGDVLQVTYVRGGEEAGVELTLAERKR